MTYRMPPLLLMYAFILLLTRNKEVGSRENFMKFIVPFLRWTCINLKHIWSKFNPKICISNTMNSGPIHYHSVPGKCPNVTQDFGAAWMAQDVMHWPHEMRLVLWIREWVLAGDTTLIGLLYNQPATNHIIQYLKLQWWKWWGKISLSIQSDLLIRRILTVKVHTEMSNSYLTYDDIKYFWFHKDVTILMDLDHKFQLKSWRCHH